MPGMKQIQKCDSRQSKITKTKQQVDISNLRDEFSQAISLGQNKIITDFPLENMAAQGMIPISAIQQQLGQVAFIPILTNEGNVAIPVNTLNALSAEQNIADSQYLSSAEKLVQSRITESNSDISRSLLKISPESKKFESDKLSEESTQHINYLKKLSNKYRTTPCKNYHGPQGCGRGTFCHFIHLVEFEGKEIPKDISQKARLAYTNKRNKVIKEINDSDSKCGLSDIRIRVLYQYTQNFMRLNEIMEFAEKQKQSQLAPQINEQSKYESSVQKHQSSYLLNEKSSEPQPNQNQSQKPSFYQSLDGGRPGGENNLSRGPAALYNKQAQISVQKPFNSSAPAVQNLPTVTSKAGSFIRVVQNQNSRNLYSSYPAQAVQVGSSSAMQNAYNSYLMGTSKELHKK